MSIDNDSKPPVAKKIKLSLTERNKLKSERERLKKEREALRIEREKSKIAREMERIEKEKEKIEKEKLKMKQKEEREAEKEKKQQEAQMKKMAVEKEKLDKLKQKEEERERKEREKKEKDDEKNRIREEKEKEKQRKQEEKLAIEERKKQEEQDKEKMLQKSREVLFKFLKKPKTSTDNEQISVSTNQPNENVNIFDVDKFESELMSQSMAIESLYLNQILNGEIECRVTPQPQVSYNSHNDECIIDEELIGSQDKFISQDKFTFIQFSENIRPAFFGKRAHFPTQVSGKNPFFKEEYLDYGVDSDEEWDEGGPGESLSGSDSEHEEKDDYLIDDEFFVPHGYLSDDENEISEMDYPDDQKHTGPLLKENTLMNERNRKLSSFIPHVIGCIWTENKDQFIDKYTFLQQFKAVPLPIVNKQT
ncbi:Chromatin assembly factor 1, subunit A [Blomia tropicalis]|nr:Chromatin assembly factor 1, subunit A [Blomia tropicalis]